MSSDGQAYINDPCRNVLVERDEARRVLQYYIVENQKLRERIELLEDTLREVIELHASYDNIVKTIIQVTEGDEEE